MENENDYKKLAEHLDKLARGWPQIAELQDLLHATFTSQEVKVALGLPVKVPPFELEDIDKIAEKVHMDLEEVQDILDGLVQKNFVYQGTTKNGKPGYGMIQNGYGFPQVFFWKGEKTPEAEQVSKIIGPHYHNDTVIQSFAGPKTRNWRFLPIEEAVSHSLQTVLPHERIVEIIKKASIISVNHCICRSIFEFSGKRACSHSLENCLKFDEMAEFCIGRGLGRKVSTDEALAISKKTEEEGLVHFTDNCQDDVKHNCNCCPCCCWALSAIKKKVAPRDYVMATYYLRDTDIDACDGCETCVDECPLEIITMEDGFPVVDESMCVGCGVCISACPIDAAILKPKGDGLIAPASFKDLHSRMIEERWG